MADDDNNNDDYNDNNNYNNVFDDDYTDDGWDNYVETTVQPTRQFFILFVLLTVLPMLVLVPCMVVLVQRQKARQKKKEQMKAVVTTMSNREGSSIWSEPYYVMEEEEEEEGEGSSKSRKQQTSKKKLKKKSKTIPPLIYEIETDVTKIRSTPQTIFRLTDKETKRILRYALPFTFSEVTSSISHSVCLALIAHFVGTKQVSAFVVVDILLSISQDISDGPLSATSTLCSHAVGAGRTYLAGQYVQLSCIFFVAINMPLVLFWFVCMERVVLALDWGDEIVAGYAHDLTRIYVFRYVVDSLQHGIDVLLDITDHVTFTTIMDLCQSVLNVGLLILMIRRKEDVDMTVELVAWMYVLTSLGCFVFVICWSWSWLKPFRRGMLCSWALGNSKAVKNMSRTSIPLSIGSALSNAEWTVLAFFASHLGPAEVASWGFIGTLWEAIDSATEGIGDAAELRVAYHLGNNNPNLAKLCAYKCLYLGFIMSLLISCVLFSCSKYIPGWLTPDDTLERLIGDSLPYMAIGNITFVLGMLCWYLVGAQGRGKLGTWIQFGTSWGVTIPLAAIFTYVYNFSVSALTASVVLGYVMAGTCLSYIILTSDWQAVADKVRSRGCDDTEESDDSDGGCSDNDGDENGDDDEEPYYAALASAKRRATARRAVLGRNNRLLIAPPGPIQINIGAVDDRGGDHSALPPVVVDVPPSSTLYGLLFAGDVLLAVDGVDVTSKPLWEVFDLLRNGRGGDEGWDMEEEEKERQLAVSITPFAFREEKEGEDEVEESAADGQDGSRRGGMLGSFGNMFRRGKGQEKEGGRYNNGGVFV